MAGKRPRAQYAALPFAVVDGSLRVMLVTSRDTGRWVVPKGWPEKNTKPCDQAAREAYEEAGALGRISKKPFGSYRYDKRLRKRTIVCTVEVYLLKVEQELEDWPERGQRIKRWMSPDEAAALVGEPDLVEMLLRLNAPAR
ncbi:MAG: NUDIX hydrolase [Rhodospirillaceae bacterium]